MKIRLKPPTVEQRSPNPEPRDLKWLASFERAQQKSDYIRQMLSYGHRRWCVVRSEGEIVLAVRRDIVFVIDFEEMPPLWPWRKLAAWQRTTHGGAHVYLPPELTRDPEWQERTRDYFIQTMQIRDRKYSKLSAQRGYFHERPRWDFNIPPQVVAPDGWLETLDNHRRWHEYAIKVKERL